MSRMKHLLRKLHIGGSVNDHQRLPENRPNSHSPSPSSSASTATAPASRTAESAAPAELRRGGAGGTLTATAAAAAAPASVPAVDDQADFNFFEEEFQVQLALAMSVSDPDACGDPESAQIKAAKRISLGCAPSPDETLVEFLSLRYWNYNFINYDEKVIDGFYDVYGVVSNQSLQGKLPSLVDLQGISVSDKVDYEVVLVNRTVDHKLQQLELRALSIASECRAAQLGPAVSGLVQKIADLVADSMGGPVGDADDMLKRWRIRSQELRRVLNTIVFPLGCLGVGLSRHRALLFKVLADRINLPCRLVKGSYYTGTDEGAVNMIKIDAESEYIIDLMGAPGTLIPAEIPSSHLQSSGFEIMSSSNIEQTVKDLYLALDKEVNFQFEKNLGTLEGISCDSNLDLKLVGSVSDDSSRVCLRQEEDDAMGVKPVAALGRSCVSSFGMKEAASTAQEMKVKDVSKYVISAAQDPEFAQKLHAVLLESGASPPPDLFSDISSPQDVVEGKVQGHRHITEGMKIDNSMANVELSLVPSVGPVEFRNKQECLSDVAVENCGQDTDVSGRRLEHQKSIQTSSMEKPGTQCFQGSVGKIPKYVEAKGNVSSAGQEKVNESIAKFIDTAYINLHAANSNSESSNSMLNDVAEWEIPWEDLQIGERIGLGSYGEVYRADWNGTEVAVKKFLDQDLSGDALQQFRCEVEIMLRLRHPNVVLFMGAVTHPPNLSILTEFLPRGSLFRLLHRSAVQLDEKRRLKMALDVAKGMNYLHTSHPTIVHRDLKSPNLLVDKNWVVKVCDFGLSRLKHHTFLSSKSTAGTPEWMAPEVLRNELSNEKCDVYSFGVILWELATLNMPWSGMNPMQVVGAVGFQNRRLEIPTKIDPMVAQIIRDCWQSDPNLRPSFSQLLTPLKHLKRLIIEVT